MKLALFYSDTRPTLFEKAAEENGFEVQSFHFQEINAVMSEKENDMRMNNCSLGDFSAVMVRNCWGYEHEVALLGNFCKQKKIPLIDSALYHPFFDSKLLATQNLASYGVPIPRTLFMTQKKDLPRLLATIDFPIVAKKNEESREHDVHLLKTKDECMAFIAEKKLFLSSEKIPSYHFQEFIPADTEIRVLVVGAKVLGAMERTPFLHNDGLTKTKRGIPLTQKMEEIARAATRLSHFEFAGIDFLLHRKTGKLFFLEINRCPHHKDFVEVTGVDVLSELMKFCSRLVHHKNKTPHL